MVGVGLSVATVVWAAVAHRGFGPDLAGESGPLWLPSGFLSGTVASLPFEEGALPAIAIGAVPPLLLTIGVFFTTRSALARWLAVTATIASACFGFYGIQFDTPWRFFGGYWSGTQLVFSLAVGTALCAVLLARSWRSLPIWARVATYLPLLLAVVFYERNVTGTDPSLPFAISPWPAAQVFGLETIATSVAFLLLGIGAGLWLFARLLERVGRYPALGIGAVVGVSLPGVALAAGSRLELLPFAVNATMLQAVLVLSAITLIAACATLVGQPAGLSQRAKLYLAAGVLLAIPLLGGQAMARFDYSYTRDTLAQRIIDALDAYYEKTDGYPEDLSELVTEGYLDEIPEPRIGFAAVPTQDGFVYQNFGTSYLLEFSSPRWIQCAYNPPFGDEDDFDEEDLEEGEDLGGAWSCPSKPPELW